MSINCGNLIVCLIGFAHYSPATFRLFLGKEGMSSAQLQELIEMIIFSKVIYEEHFNCLVATFPAFDTHDEELCLCIVHRNYSMLENEQKLTILQFY